MTTSGLALPHRCKDLKRSFQDDTFGGIPQKKTTACGMWKYSEARSIQTGAP
jgi:hypothetical protein